MNNASYRSVAINRQLGFLHGVSPAAAQAFPMYLPTLLPRRSFCVQSPVAGLPIRKEDG